MRLRFCVLLISLAAWAYNPPSDTAGPLTVRLQAPASGAYGSGGFVELSRPGLRLVIPVHLANSASVALSGRLRMAVTDHWRVESPSEIPFQVPARGHARYEFRLTFSAGTHNAHYPVHVYADFQHLGAKLTAHPVLLLQPRIPNLARPRLPIEWKPVPVPAGSTFGLWRLPVRRESAEVVNPGVETAFSTRETYDSASLVQYGALPRANETREGIAMTLGPRPPSERENVEAAMVDYALALPDTTPLRLEFEASGSSAFRVVATPWGGAAETVLWQRSLTAGAWQKAQLDLSPYRGKSIRLRLEARGGHGEALWAEPTLTSGQAPAPPPFPPDRSSASKALGQAGPCQVRLYSGRRGLLDAPIGFVCPNETLFFQGFRVRVNGDALEDARASTQLIASTEEASAGRARMRHRFRGWAGAFDIVIELWVERDALRSHVWMENGPADQAWFHLGLEAASAGPWSRSPERIYGGPGNVIVQPQAFRLGYDGHNLSSSFVGFDFPNGLSLVQNSETTPDALEANPRTHIATLVSPHEARLSFFPAESVWAGVLRLRQQDARKASAGVPQLAGRFTFDLWSGHYAESARQLQRAVRYGLTNSLVVWHNWQRWGYDYRLPDIYPPNPEYGTLQEFQDLAETCHRAGVLFAPHDNYIDFYPDFEGFSYADIAFRPNGQPYRAWFNYGREAQSYRVRADRLRPYLERNVNLIQKGFPATAYFIDVWSSMAPYDYWTEDGRFITRDTTRQVWGESFAWIREKLGGNAPQISEAGHDQLIGWLDGADAQQLRIDPEGPSFTWHIRCADSERIPWIDLAWHDKFILHGAGYPGRYEGGQDSRAHGIYSDDYMATEVLSGRPPMVDRPFSRDVVRKYWLLDEAMSALALDRISAVSFEANDIHRQHVKWTRGGEVWVNRGGTDWTVAGHTLPPYGFYARVPGKSGTVEAAVERLSGNVVEWSRSVDNLYVNGRGHDISFDAVHTAGAFHLTRATTGMELTPLPDSGDFALTLNPERLPWKQAALSEASAFGEDGARLGATPLATSARGITLNCAKGIFRYRLGARP
jgi:hypothetical protein